MTHLETSAKSIAGDFAAAAKAQIAWAATPLRERLRLVRRVRNLLAERASTFPANPAAELLAGQVLPFADACRFLEKNAPSILATRRLGARGRPNWLFGVDSEIRREPFGVVLIIAPSNYPLLLPGVQTIQALAAGNAVMLKPGKGGGRMADVIKALLVDAGLNPELLAVLPDSIEAGKEALSLPVSKVFFTGSFEVGTQVLGALATRAIPCVAELSGCDAVFIRDDADLKLAVRAVAFGLRFNSGETCIAPRRVLIARRVAERFEAMLCDALPGCTIPLIATDSDEHALELAVDCPYELGATIFSNDIAAAQRLASRVRAGSVVINDLIVPTADPRIPFGGRARSGFGVTRGAEGLLEMTTVKVVQLRRGRARPHFDPSQPGDETLFQNWIEASHGRSLRKRLAAMWRIFAVILSVVKRSGTQSKDPVGHLGTERCSETQQDPSTALRSARDDSTLR